MVINTPATLLTELANIVAGTLSYVKVHLFTNDITPTPTNVKADFTEATFPGYAASATVTWNTPYLDASLNGNVLGDTKEFILSSDSVTQTIYGYYLLGKQGADTVGITLIASERFANPVPLSYTGQAVPVVPAYQLGQ